MGPEDTTHPIRESKHPGDGRDEYSLFKAKQEALKKYPLSRSGLPPPRERQLESQSVIGSLGPMAPCKSKQCEVSDAGKQRVLRWDPTDGFCLRECTPSRNLL